MKITITTKDIEQSIRRSCKNGVLATSIRRTMRERGDDREIYCGINRLFIVDEGKTVSLKLPASAKNIDKRFDRGDDGFDMEFFVEIPEKPVVVSEDSESQERKAG